ncbi:unnamed protein product [Linum trigynum]|uniref:Uncharacterized protein n=1 Tax=Linum trigynum TaxID=586398 RepID=A0AAV2DBY0_9ROSI
MLSISTTTTSLLNLGNRRRCSNHGEEDFRCFLAIPALPSLLSSPIPLDKGEKVGKKYLSNHKKRGVGRNLSPPPIIRAMDATATYIAAAVTVQARAGCVQIGDNKE